MKRKLKPIEKLTSMMTLNSGRVSRDKMTIYTYSVGRLSYEKALAEIFANNQIEEPFDIDEEDFIRWIESLGYQKRRDI